MEKRSKKELRFKILSLFSWIPDKPWLLLLYRIKNGYWMDMDNPKTFNEKLQWLKIHDRKPEYTQMVDKLDVKNYVAKRIGEEYVIPTFAVWDDADSIAWEELPKRFVLKTTNGGGGTGVIICQDKERLDKQAAIKSLKDSLVLTGIPYREHPYDGVKKRIMAEALLEDPEGDDLRDYKFFCFNGVVKFFKVDFGRYVEHRANYYSVDAKLLPYGEKVCPPDPSADIKMPPNLNEMITLAESLSKGIQFLRVDLYNVGGQIFFGELTFFPASGLSKWTDFRWDKEIGNMLTLV